MAEVIKTKFLREFQRNLFPDNSFWRRGRSDSGADAFSTIEIPQAMAQVTSTFGTIQGGQANLATANSLSPLVRLNTKLSYTINTFGTNPVALQLSDLGSLSYNKRQELFTEHREVIATNIANFCAIAWAQDDNTELIVQTTGTPRENIVIGGFKGQVRGISKEDIITVKRLFHRMNITTIAGRLHALITPEHWSDLLKIPDFVDYEKTGNESKLVEGIVGRLLGIEFMIPRHNAALNANVVYTANNTKVAFGAGIPDSGRSAAIFFHSGLVRYAAGRGMLYERGNDPEYKADIMSADARFGATKTRNDAVGVVSLVEAAVVEPPI